MGRVDPRRWSLARQISSLLAAALAAVVLAGVSAAYLQARHTVLDAAEQHVLAVAQAVASTPDVGRALTGPDPARVLQPLAERVRSRTGTDFVVVMSPAGVRYSHPNPELVGGHFLGHIAPAAAGTPFTETYAGTLGPSVRSVVPVRASEPDGPIVGLVAVGITVESVSETLAGQVRALAVAALVALAATVAVARALGRRLRRQTHDLGPTELSRMYEFYDAVLHAVREGVLLLDRQGRVQLVNDEARRLLDLPVGTTGRPVLELGLAPGIGEVLAAGERHTDEVHLTADRVVVLNQAPAAWHGRALGTVVTLRDHTELTELTGELDSVRGLSEALRSQAHEAANRLHAVISLIELGHPDRALELATAELAEAQHLTDQVMGAVSEPILAALLLGKAAQAAERGVDLNLGPDLDLPEGLLPARDVVTVVGNLVDNAIDAAAGSPSPRWVRVRAELRAGPTREIVVQVTDSGPGLATADLASAFSRGWSTKPSPDGGGRGLGLALVAQTAHRYDGTVTVDAATFTVRIPLAVHRTAP